MKYQSKRHCPKTSLHFNQYVEKEIHYQITKLSSSNASGFVDKCSKEARNQVLRRANRTVELNAARDGVRYARVPMGCGCTFCAMLASRGFVYHSAKSAGEDNHYHNHCRCKVVPEFGKVEGYDSKEWGKRWRQMEKIDNDKSLTRKEKQEAKNAVGNGVSYKEWMEDNRRASVDFKRIESKTYARIYKDILGEGNIADMVITDARRVLKHRAGSLYEDLYVYDLTTGKRIGSVTNHNERQTVRPTKKLKDKMKRAKADNHVLFDLHNHPHSSIPSFSDIDWLAKSGSSFGLIPCHDGSVYRYSIVGKPMPGYTLTQRTFEIAYYDRLKSGKTEEQILKAMEMELGVKIEHFR